MSAIAIMMGNHSDLFFSETMMHLLTLHFPFLHDGLHKDHQALPGIRLKDVSKGQYKVFKTSIDLKGNILTVF